MRLDRATARRIAEALAKEFRMQRFGVELEWVSDELATRMGNPISVEKWLDMKHDEAVKRLVPSILRALTPAKPPGRTKRGKGRAAR